MAVVASRPVAGSPAVLLAQNTASSDASDASVISVLLRNTTGTGSVWLGPSGVDSTTGFEWEVDDGPIALDLEPGESLYGYATIPQTIQTLKAGR